MAFVSTDVSTLHANSEIHLEPQHVICATGLLDYLSDEDAVDLLDWSLEHLVPGGMALLSSLSPANPDRLLIEHVLQWRMSPRDAEDLADLVARSRFGRAAEIAPVADGIIHLATIKRSAP
jgi:hypothetical protein